MKKLDKKTGKVDIAYVSCCDCKYQSNKPSYCKKKEAYVARKQEICSDFRR